jgi:membrane peptidoglycan carboxypeptidase
MNTPIRKRQFRGDNHLSHTRKPATAKNFLADISGWNFWSMKNFMKIIGILILFGSLILGLMTFIFMRGVPNIASIERGDYFQESTVIYDKDNNPIYTLFNDGKRTYAEYPSISDSIKNAIVSTEDKTFFENPGIDIKGLFRAGYNYISGKTARIQGTSTLSQQLISYTLLSKERSIKRKVQEAYLSYMLNKSYSKEKILEMYLNTISYGYNANGVEEAAKTFFGKSAKDVGPL